MNFYTITSGSSKFCQLKGESVKMQKTIFVLIAFGLVACSSAPSGSSIQTAITHTQVAQETSVVQTQQAQPTNTLEPTSAATDVPTPTGTPTLTKTSTSTSESCAVLAKEFYESMIDLSIDWQNNLSIVLGVTWIKPDFHEPTEDDKIEADLQVLRLYFAQTDQDLQESHRRGSPVDNL